MLLLHVVLGLALVLISFVLIVLSIVDRQRSWVAASLIAAGGIIIATLSGASFVDTGVAASSLVMSIGFLLSLISYEMGLYMTR